MMSLMYAEEGRELIAVDLPGAYSMSPFTSEESITRDYVKNEHPDVIVNIVDATNLIRRTDREVMRGKECGVCRT